MFYEWSISVDKFNNWKNLNKYMIQRWKIQKVKLTLQINILLVERLKCWQIWRNFITWCFCVYVLRILTSIFVWTIFLSKFITSLFFEWANSCTNRTTILAYLLASIHSESIEWKIYKHYKAKLFHYFFSLKSQGIKLEKTVNEQYLTRLL